jgi:hypothetical protein
MTTMRRIALVLVLAVLVPAEVAQAGGWATVELSEAPSGLVAGTPWRVELIVKQHGMTPLAGVQPRIRIANDAGETRSFPARATARTGHYVADVTFPAAGAWHARIFDGFTDATPHRISTLTVAPSAGAAPGGHFPWEQTVMITIVALLFLGGWLAAGGDTVPAREQRAARGRRRTTPRAVA